MDTEDRILLEKVEKLSQENNQMLKKLVQAMRWGRIVKIFYWTLIIGTSVGIFYYFQPLFDQIKDVYGGFSDSVTEVNSFFGR
jgi:hypothetical protein